MTTFAAQKVTCRVCGRSVPCTVLTSTNAFGAPDLDLRPPQMKRDTMHMWVQECPHCGYVASDLTDKTSVDTAWLRSPEYKNSNKLGFRSPLALRFYKQHLICLKDGNRDEAFFALLHAAWACDDLGDKKSAVFCRKAALPLLEEMIDKKNDDNLTVLRADLLRRAGCFTELRDRYENLRLGDELLDKIIAFQLQKAKEKDDGCYRTADVE